MSEALPEARRLAWLKAIVFVPWLAASLSHAPSGTAAEAASASLWQRLQRAAWVAQGAEHPEHVVYVITDANCPFCHDLWLSLQPLYAHKLQVRYVMVGILSSSSPGKAAAVLEAPSPSVALDRNEKQWARLTDDPGGGIAPLRKPRTATLAALEANERLMHDLGLQGTPGLIYRGADALMHVNQSAPNSARLKSIVDAASPD